MDFDQITRNELKALIAKDKPEEAIIQLEKLLSDQQWHIYANKLLLISSQLHKIKCDQAVGLIGGEAAYNKTIHSLLTFIDEVFSQSKDWLGKTLSDLWQQLLLTRNKAKLERIVFTLEKLSIDHPDSFEVAKLLKDARGILEYETEFVGIRSFRRGANYTNDFRSLMQMRLAHRLGKPEEGVVAFLSIAYQHHVITLKSALRNGKDPSFMEISIEDTVQDLFLALQITLALNPQRFTNPFLILPYLIKQGQSLMEKENTKKTTERKAILEFEQRRLHYYEERSCEEQDAGWLRQQLRSVITNPINREIFDLMAAGLESKEILIIIGGRHNIQSALIRKRKVQIREKLKTELKKWYKAGEVSYLPF